jgi:hypothetical protein
VRSTLRAIRLLVPDPFSEFRAIWLLVPDPSLSTMPSVKKEQAIT